jgi:hypothetical protein
VAVSLAQRGRCRSEGRSVAQVDRTSGACIERRKGTKKGSIERQQPCNANGGTGSTGRPLLAQVDPS